MVEVIRKKVLDKTDMSLELSDDALWEIIDDTILWEYKDEYLSLSQRISLQKKVFNSIRGLDIIDELLEDDEITEIMINGPNEIFIEKHGTVSPCHLSFSSTEKLSNVIQQIAALSNKRINQMTPVTDTSLKDGSRVNIVLSPISLCSSVITIRKFGHDRLTMEKLYQYGSIDMKTLQLLDILVKSRYNIFVCGGTGSGKTTFLNALSHFIPSDERIITIEDSPELNINSANKVNLITRPPNSEGQGEITIRDLIKTSLRMRPDRIIVGEVRGPEAIDMLQAMSTGHDGSLSTGHGNSVSDMLMRLETMILMGMNIPLRAVKAMIASSIDIIIHLGRLPDKSRKLLEISEICGISDDNYVINPICKRIFAEESSHISYMDYTLKNTYKLSQHNLIPEYSDIMSDSHFTVSG